MSVDAKTQTRLQQECQALLDSQTGVLGVVVASIDGFDVASAVTQNVEPEKIAAMASSISAIGMVVSQEAALGKGTSVTVNTESGFVYISHIEYNNAPYILNVIANSAAVLAQIIYRCTDIKRRLTLN